MAVLPQSTVYVRSFVMYLTGTKTAATGKAVTVNLCKSGAAFGVAAGAVAEIANGWYKVSLTIVDTNTVGDLAFNCTAAACDPTDFTDQVGATPANVIQIDGNSTNGNNATLNLKKLNVVNNAGDAAVFSSTGGNGNGINSSGNGAGHGAFFTAGATGNGITFFGGVTSGSGLAATAIGGGAGMFCLGVGANSGIVSQGGATGHGINAVGGVTSGSGLYANAVGSGNGIVGIGTNNGAGMYCVGNGTNSGIATIGGANGYGLNCVGGSVSGDGITATAVGNGRGMSLIGVGGPSLLATQGISGPLDVATYNAMADAALVRDWTVIAGVVASRSTLNALRTFRNKWSISGSTMTITTENDATPAWTATLVTDGTALPVVSFTGN